MLDGRCHEVSPRWSPQDGCGPTGDGVALWHYFVLAKADATCLALISCSTSMATEMREKKSAIADAVRPTDELALMNESHIRKPRSRPFAMPTMVREKLVVPDSPVD